ncbi:MAG: circularly permuted type 2 ATP-grasp protein [Acidobacteriota bacterium]|nr:circularly permuted type 2 ATP-grasp protein [Blastocatellia bacterium]MDW8238533.1 circularly permuted type 2 ATP-grasp protein [Acidobacteriota bacterium]
MLKEAVTTYHTLLEQNNGIERTREQLWQRLNEVEFVFGGRMLSPFLRPHFVTRQQFEFIRSVCEGLWPAILKVADHALREPELLDYLGVTETERRLISFEPGYQGVSRTARLDSFLTQERYSFVELNAETPAGIAYSDVATEIFLKLDVMKEFAKHYRVTPLSGREKLLNVLLAAYQEFSGSDHRPNIAIVDLPGLPTRREFELFQEFFESRGLNAIIAHPQELEFRQGKLYAGDFRVDLIYKRLLVNELIEVMEQAQGLLEACQAGAVCMVNSFRGKLIHKKLLFGVLTDEQFAHLFTEAERTLIRQHVPWTRRFEPRKTTYYGQEIDLIAFARQRRDQLVLKPNDEYGGKGIFIGWECDEAAWDAAIESALTHPYLLQERVTTAREVFPWIIDGTTVDFVEQLVDLDPLLFDGHVGSAFTRLSSSELCNVTAGGGMVPTFILEN